MVMSVRTIPAGTIWYSGVMKINRQCPKCGSLKVVWYAIEGRKKHPENKVTYLCVECGYYENYRTYPVQLLEFFKGVEYSDGSRYRIEWVNPQPGEHGPFR